LQNRTPGQLGVVPACAETPVLFPALLLELPTSSFQFFPCRKSFTRSRFAAGMQFRSCCKNSPPTAGFQPSDFHVLPHRETHFRRAPISRPGPLYGCASWIETGKRDRLLACRSWPIHRISLHTGSRPWTIRIECSSALIAEANSSLPRANNSFFTTSSSTTTPSAASPASLSAAAAATEPHASARKPALNARSAAQRQPSPSGPRRAAPSSAAPASNKQGREGNHPQAPQVPRIWGLGIATSGGHPIHAAQLAGTCVPTR
jgi:hypothetical protein